ncbi:radical SAM family heme chaperone HemW [uncultured Jannaschia sp.]|uniref:radical SAM family heme chaperone HemW n=1 Tax=uncultured Jannaschia sp. TaxID=293347 RepID=UPI002620F43C|nr:radical SAM family heme chaperone HemW [uncultured Jannaschia sp.]
MTLANWQEAGFGLYLHWPFCAAKCPYCDFNSHVAASIDHAAWQRAYLSDLDHWAARTPGRVLTSVFLGGGTPSLMQPEVVAAILERIHRNWTVANDLEVTLEANPGSVDADRFAAFHAAGVNRFSVGLQALNDEDLRRLGRLHTVAEGRAAFEVAASLTDRVSFDLIYARQDQSLGDWEAELRSALSQAGEHLSLYQLTIEDGTAFGARHAAGGLRGLPTEELSVAQYEITQALTAEAGLRRYEVSNHARPGAESRHNLIYWRGGDWLGVGPGAHGRVALDGARLATVAHRAPGAWLQAVARQGHGIETTEPLPATEIADEYALMSLRLTEGMDLARHARLGGAIDAAEVAALVQSGHLMEENGRLRATEAGILVLNALLGRILGEPPRE